MAAGQGLSLDETLGEFYFAHESVGNREPSVRHRLREYAASFSTAYREDFPSQNRGESPLADACFASAQPGISDFVYRTRPHGDSFGKRQRKSNAASGVRSPVAGTRLLLSPSWTTVASLIGGSEGPNAVGCGVVKVAGDSERTEIDVALTRPSGRMRDWAGHMPVGQGRQHVSLPVTRVPPWCGARRTGSVHRTPTVLLHFRRRPMTRTFERMSNGRWTR